ncbi:MAG: hypothetical protein I8H71_02085 [Xanthomonadaceae bacterium]|nr:hypothetical protein [Xanthomonadaceae bacterium]
MQDHQISAYIKFSAKLIEANPKNLDIVKNSPSFIAIQRHAVASIANADSWPEAVQAYDMYSPLLPGWKFVFASVDGMQLDHSINREFSDGSVVRGLFSTKSLKVLDPESRKNGEPIPIDYSISLDTQAVSYLFPFINGNTQKLPKDYHEIFSFIAKDNVYVDATPYITENLPNVLDKEKQDPIKRRLKGYEVLRSMDTKLFENTKEIRSVLTESELDTRANKMLKKMIANASNPIWINELQTQHKYLYSTLLKMTTIHLRDHKRAADEKLHEFLEFLDKTLNTIFARETIIAAEYFKKDRDLLFFKKIHRSKAQDVPKLLTSLRNMAWDLFHLRSLERKATIGGGYTDESDVQPRYFFPFLLTCDKDYIDIINLYPLKSYAYSEQGDIEPFPAIDWFSRVTGSTIKKEYIIDCYYSNSAIQRRETQRDAVKNNLTQIIEDLEKDFSDAAISVPQ